MRRVALTVLLADVDHLLRIALPAHLALPAIVQPRRIVGNQRGVIRIAPQHLVSPGGKRVVLPQLGKVVIAEPHILSAETVGWYLPQTVKALAEVTP